MSRGNEFFKNTVILFIGIFFTKVIQYLLLPVYTSYLTTSEYGQFELYNTIITLLIPIIGLQADQGVFRFLINKRDNNKETKEIISSAFYFVVSSIIFYLLLFLVFNKFVSVSYKWLIVLNVILNSLSSLFLQISRGIGDNKDYSFSSFITSLFTIAFNMIFIIGIGVKVDGMLYGGAIGYCMGTLYLFFKIKMYKYISLKSVNFGSLKMIIKYSLPMIPNSISWWIFSSSDRVIISAFIGLSATGILSIAYKFSNALIIVYNVFNMSLTESVSLHISDIDIEAYFNKIYDKIGNIFISLSLLVLSFMPIIFNILVKGSYGDAYNLIPIAILATIMQIYSGMLGTLYVAKNNTKSIAITSILAAIVNIIVDLLLVKIIGVYAAVVSTLLSFVVLWLYRTIDVKNKYFNIYFNRKSIVNILLFVLLFIIYYINNAFMIVLSIIISIIATFVMNKDNIAFLMNFLRRKKV